MIYSIENDVLKISVRKFGCELTSIKSKSSCYEYLWQGNPDIWSGQSPVLFPIIGRLIEDKYTLDGKKYEMEKHGFARRNDWEFAGSDDTSLTFILKENENTLKSYPYCFELIVKFILKGNRLTVEHKIVNKSKDVMYFSIGAHPAFNCEIGDRLVFDEKESLEAIKIDLVNSLRLPEATPFLKNESEIIITEDVFKEDALIFKGVKSENITLVTGDRKIKFNLGKAPYLGIWAKPGAPYVCIEPWYGVNDSTEKKADFSQKDAINSVNPDECFTFTWYAEFSE